MKRANESTKIRQIIEENQYEGIRDQDGMETLTLTVQANHPSAIATAILTLLQPQSSNTGQKKAR